MSILLSQAADLDEPYLMASNPTLTFPNAVVWQGVKFSGTTPPADTRWLWENTTGGGSVLNYYNTETSAWAPVTDIVDAGGLLAVNNLSDVDSIPTAVANLGLSNALIVYGAWSSATAYPADAVVVESGSVYYCILANTNEAPPNATYWQALGSGGGGSVSIVGENLGGTKNGSNTSFTFASAPVGSTEAVYWNGLRQLRGTDYTLTGSALTATTAPASGDTLVADYYTTAGTDIVVGESVTGTKNGTNPTFTFANMPNSNSEAVYWNGLRQLRGTDYTVSGSTLTAVNCIPASGDTLIVDYVY